MPAETLSCHSFRMKQNLQTNVLRFSNSSYIALNFKSFKQKHLLQALTAVWHEKNANYIFNEKLNVWFNHNTIPQTFNPLTLFDCEGHALSESVFL